MSDTNDMRRDFEESAKTHDLDLTPDDYYDGFYKSSETDYAWIFWQAATKRATAIERERCAALCDVECELNNGKVSNVSYSDFATLTYLARAAGAKDCAAAIRQGGAT